MNLIDPGTALSEPSPSVLTSKWHKPAQVSAVKVANGAVDNDWQEF